MSGLLIAGHVVEVPGCTVYNPLDTPWCKLSPRDYRTRRTKWIRQLIAHTTLGKWPQKILMSPAPDTDGAGARATADWWRKSDTQSSAPIVIDFDGDVACLADVVTACCYHAGTSNEHSIGIEMKQRADGGIYDATLRSFVAVCKVLCEHVGIPFQVAADKYTPGQIIGRMRDGGADCVGIFGHRDQAWKFPHQLSAEERKRFPNGRADRGRGDPGDEPPKRLALAGAELFNYGAAQDLSTWKARQRKLNAMGERLAVDGICGPGTMGALRRRGFASGRELDAAA